MKNQEFSHSTKNSSNEANGLWVGNRIPCRYFETSGIGESDLAIHAGSYHLALQNAGIGNYNIMTYSSILPGMAEKIHQPDKMDHGAVLEAIISVSHSGKGVVSTAGIICGWLYDKGTGKKHGGIVCEHAGNYDKTELNKRLTYSLEELYLNTYAEHYILKDIGVLEESFVPEKKYGTALVALCFTSYYYPIVNP